MPPRGMLLMPIKQTAREKAARVADVARIAAEAAQQEPTQPRPAQGMGHDP